MRRTGIGTGLIAGALVVAGCSSGGGAGTSAATGPAPGGPAAASTDLSTWTSPLGAIVIAGSGRTVYVFDKDSPGSGTSACTGGCASLWRAVTTTAATPSVSGVTGAVGTITRADGAKQLTLAGHPLYTYAGDSASGQTTGQGVQHVWWVVSPTGAKITAAPAAADTSGYVGY